MSAVLLVGEAPSRTSDPSRPLEGRSGRWLASLVGMTWRELEEVVHVRNLLDAYPGPVFPLAEARIAALRLVAWAEEEIDTVVLLGRNVARAYGVDDDFPILTWTRVHYKDTIVVPHPSGLNRWWNPEENRDRGRAAVREILERSARAGTEERRPPLVHRWKRRAARGAEVVP